MPTPTNVRIGRITALLAGIQSAKGTPVSDFTAGASGRLWTDAFIDDLGPAKADGGGWMDRPQISTDARHGIDTVTEGRLVAKATPLVLGWLLRSNWGSYAAGAWTLKDQVNEWLTFGWVESILSGATEKLHRLSDAWVHRLTLRAGPYQPLTLEADFAAEVDHDPVTLNALGGITLPGGTMAPSDQNIFPGRLVRLFRDPTGANVEISLDTFALTFDQGLGTFWDMCGGKDRVFKAGYPGPRVGIEFSAHVSDETWAILTASRDGTKGRYRMTATSENPTQTLQIDLHEVDFEFEPIGHAGQRYLQFSAVGQAHRDSSDNFVTISLT